MQSTPTSVVFTNKARCRDCYRCLRACPVKAIRMKDGQAYVVEDRCIACGTCVRECPQGAKTIRVDVEKAQALLKTNAPVAASVRPMRVRREIVRRIRLRMPSGSDSVRSVACPRRQRTPSRRLSAAAVSASAASSASMDTFEPAARKNRDTMKPRKTVRTLDQASFLSPRERDMANPRRYAGSTAATPATEKSRVPRLMSSRASAAFVSA